MKRLLLAIAILVASAPAVAVEGEKGTFALEPFIRYGTLGEPDIRWSGGGETQHLRRLETGWRFDTGVRFIVPVSSRLDVRGFASIAKTEDKDRGMGLSSTAATDETITKRSGYDLGISVRYWVRMGSDE